MQLTPTTCMLCLPDKVSFPLFWPLLCVNAGSLTLLALLLLTTGH